MPQIKIVSRYASSEVRWKGDAQTVREAVLKALEEGADLEGANLRRAYLQGANLRSANLQGADLEGADLEGIKEDFYKILSVTKTEVSGLWKALHDGKVDGATYTGECACLVGTIANVKGVNHEDIPNLKPDESRPAEKWFLAIRKGDSPDSNQVSAIVRDWIKEFAEKEGMTLPVRKIVWE